MGLEWGENDANRMMMVRGLIRLVFAMVISVVKITDTTSVRQDEDGEATLMIMYVDEWPTGWLMADRMVGR